MAEKKFLGARTPKFCRSYLISRNWTDTQAERVKTMITVQEERRTHGFAFLYLNMYQMPHYTLIHYISHYFGTCFRLRPLKA